MGDPTVGTRIAERDAAAFVGRQKELAALERHLADDARATVVYLHGPGGIGKSALLRALARRAVAAGYTLRWVEGRDVPPSPDGLEDALAGIHEAERPLIVIDSFERIAGTAGYLRRALLPQLPASTRVLLASRRPPDDGWYQGGWERSLASVEVGALTEDDATALAGSSGLDRELAADVVRWSRGSPLALTLAAEIAERDPEWRPESGTDHAEFVELVIRRLAGAEIDGPHWPTLAVSAIARSVTVPMLAEVLPDRASAEEYGWLAERTFVEPVGEGLALHHLVRDALRADLRRRDPERERELRRRIADHLYGRARDGDVLLAIDLSELIESRAIRWGYSWKASAQYHLDDVRPGDVEVFEAALAAGGHAALWRGSRTFFERFPEHVAVVRDRQGAACGYAVTVTPASAPPEADEDEVLGPRLAHARTLGEDETVVVFRDMVDLRRDPELHVIGMLGMAGMLRAARANPRYTYLIINPKLAGAREFAAALGARHVAELDVTVAPIELECHVVDHGRGGMLAHERAVIYRELGLRPPEGEQPHRDLTPAVREALRNLRRPDLLARSRLARGETAQERAAFVTVLLEEAADHAFGKGPDEELLRQVLTHGYLDPAPNHELAAERVALSRSAYFRRLRIASERVATYIERQLGE